MSLLQRSEEELRKIIIDYEVERFEYRKIVDDLNAHISRLGAENEKLMEINASLRKNDKVNVAEFVKEWLDGHEPDTFIRSKHGQIIYSAGPSSINLQVFFEDIIQYFIDMQDNKGK